MYLYHFLSHSFWFQRSYSILWCTTLISYFGVYLDFFRDHLLWGWPCIDSSLSFFLLKLYFLNVIIRISCDEDGLCVCWRISIIQFTELSQTISNARFSVNNLVNLVVLIVLCLRPNELVCIDFLNAIHPAQSKHYSGWFVELGSTSLWITSDHKSTQ